MSGVMHILPEYAFMAWCLVKVQGQLYLYVLSFNSTESSGGDDSYLARHDLPYFLKIEKPTMFKRDCHWPYLEPIKSSPHICILFI
jgi:hypothetical protein